MMEWGIIGMHLCNIGIIWMTATIDLNHLRYFLAVVDAGSFAGAARAMGLPTSNISRHIAQLEAQLGSRLLERTTRQLRMTGQGRLLHARARPLMDDLLLLEAELQDQHSTLRGVLKLSLPGEFGTRTIGPLVAEFAAQHPLLEIECQTTMTGSEPVRDDVDLAIVFQRGLPPDSSLIQQTLLSFPSIVVAAPSLIERHGMPQTVTQLTSLPCITTRAALHGRAWQFRATDGRPLHMDVQARYRVDSGEMAGSAALAGIGYALLARAACEADLAQGNLVHVKLDLEAMPLAVVACYPSHRYLAAKTRALLALLQQRLPQMVKMAP